MSKYIGDFKANTTVPVFWSSNEASGGQVAPSGGTIRVYKGAPATPVTTTTGVTSRITYNSKTGLNAVEIVTTDAFYAAGNDFAVVMEATTIDGETVTSVLAQFSIENRSDKEMVLDALDTAIPGTPTADSINERVKAIDDKLPTGTISDFDEASNPVELLDSGGSAGTSAEELVDDIFDEALSGHIAGGSSGEALNRLDDIQTKTDNLPADPASETNVDANESKIDTLQTDVTAIKTKTDNLPADPASETNVDANETKIDALQTDVTAVKAKTDVLTFTGSNVNAHVKAEDNIDFGALKKASINTEVDNALDTAIPVTPTADSINERIKSMDDRIPADPASETNVDANEAKIDIIDTVVDAIKAKTDNLPADPASETNVDANETKIDTLQTDLTAVKAKTDLLTFTGSNLHTDVKALEGQALSGKTGDNFDSFFHNGDAITTKTVDDVGGGATDWTSGEKEEIRQALGVTGTKSATSGGNLDTVQSDVAAIKLKTDNLPADPASETNVDANETKIDIIDTVVDAIKLKTDLIPADPATETNVDANEAKLDIIDTVVDAIKLKTDNLPADPASETNVDANETKIDAVQADVTIIKNNVEIIKDGLIAAVLTVQAGSTDTLVRTNATQADDFYDFQTFVVVNAAGTVARRINDYDLSNGLFTLEDALPFTPSSGDTAYVLNTDGSGFRLNKFEQQGHSASDIDGTVQGKLGMYYVRINPTAYNASNKMTAGERRIYYTNGAYTADDPPGAGSPDMITYIEVDWSDTTPDGYITAIREHK